ncbi:MAG: response regulator [Gammaproteobacteria bacterium]|nr:response regulator [Gammaproteobacteria bacterium]MCW8988688.1 response regulator [Gammaproteobacteria bacterium]MCW9030372.1 response regulator [Gammaproteobacteria bacterium]
MSVSEDQFTILVVDDSRTVRAAINKILRSTYTIVEAEDGEDAWTKLVELEKVHMVISDIMMPKLDGYGLICRIRAAKQPEISKLPIVVITSSEDALTRERAHACGANDFIIKPVSAADMVERANFHTEEKLSGKPSPLDLSTFAEIESTVIEGPDINTALEIIRGAKKGTVEAFAVDLALEVLPLLDYCNKTFELKLDSEMEKIKSALKKHTI